VSKNDREVVEILEAYDLTRSFHAAAELAGCDPKTVARYVALRDGGAAGSSAAGVVRADETHSAQPGTTGWAEYGR
jgi:hypothetical protein